MSERRSSSWVARGVAFAGMFAAMLALAGAGSARPTGTPFYVIPGSHTPSPTECKGLAYCYGVRGLWVVVPAHGEATYLFGCPEPPNQNTAFLIGGTDSLTSSTHVHVWFDGSLGAPIFSETPKSSIRGLLFHAQTDNGKAGSFEPVLGCIDLIKASKSSTIAKVVPNQGTVSPPPPALWATQALLEPGWDRPMSVACPHGETLIGGWGAAAFGSEGPPVLPNGDGVKIAMIDHGNAVHAMVRTSSAIQYLIHIQIGAMCER